ncbi:MAG: hypothetical protein LUH47_02505 [Clostridiales bacterium]|nr:hypothetical protein [Clostridiales bacterium]
MKEKIIKQAKALISENLKVWITFTESDKIRNMYIDFLMNLYDNQANSLL